MASRAFTLLSTKFFTTLLDNELFLCQSWQNNTIITSYSIYSFTRYLPHRFSLLHGIYGTSSHFILLLSSNERFLVYLVSVNPPNLADVCPSKPYSASNIRLLRFRHARSVLCPSSSIEWGKRFLECMSVRRTLGVFTRSLSLRPQPNNRQIPAEQESERRIDTISTDKYDSTRLIYDSLHDGSQIDQVRISDFRVLIPAWKRTSDASFSLMFQIPHT